MRRMSVVVTIAAVLIPVAVQAQGADLGNYSGAVRATSFSGGKDASRMSGSVNITPSAKEGVFKVEIRLSTMGASASSSSTGILQWSISPGRCGSRVQFLVPPGEAPPLEVRSGGNAEMTWEGRMPLVASEGNYQLMIYDRGFREQDIVGCANLKYNKPKS
ncbi:MAG TPA: hypothetical protein VGJ96_11605 [Gemmatimonadaceae bacterium]